MRARSTVMAFMVVGLVVVSPDLLSQAAGERSTPMR